MAPQWDYKQEAGSFFIFLLRWFSTLNSTHRTCAKKKRGWANLSDPLPAPHTQWQQALASPVSPGAGSRPGSWQVVPSSAGISCPIGLPSAPCTVPGVTGNEHLHVLTAPVPSWSMMHKSSSFLIRTTFVRLSLINDFPRDNIFRSCIFHTLPGPLLEKSLPRAWWSGLMRCRASLGRS